MQRIHSLLPGSILHVAVVVVFVSTFNLFIRTSAFLKKEIPRMHIDLVNGQSKRELMQPWTMLPEKIECYTG